MASRRFQPWRSLFPVRTDADRVHFATTHDGWRLALSRYQPSRATRNFPVVLCHGLAASYIGFDLDPEVSLARRLRSLGYDVWAIELRGHGLSDLPSLFGKQRYAWTFDDYLERDAPCILDFIRAETGIDGVHWIGHSMGGILLYALIATGCKAIRSGVTVASGLDYSVAENDFAKIAPLRKYVRFLPALPLGLVASTMAPLSGRFRNAIERFNT
ncbi:MAG TPA: alpha/beta fold hydrolase, partial [Labilithrix sp.]|nr:alpha/beta fold hydrolase [Labilithrix sp.]